MSLLANGMNGRKTNSLRVPPHLGRGTFVLGNNKRSSPLHTLIKSFYFLVTLLCFSPYTAFTAALQDHYFHRKSFSKVHESPEMKYQYQKLNYIEVDVYIYGITLIQVFVPTTVEIL